MVIIWKGKGWNFISSFSCVSWNQRCRKVLKTRKVAPEEQKKHEKLALSLHTYIALWSSFGYLNKSSPRSAHHQYFFLSTRRPLSQCQTPARPHPRVKLRTTVDDIMYCYLNLSCLCLPSSTKWTRHHRLWDPLVVHIPSFRRFKSSSQFPDLLRSIFQMPIFDCQLPKPRVQFPSPNWFPCRWTNS